MRVQRRDCGVGNAFAFALALDTRLGTLGSVFDRNETGSADSLWSFSPSQGDAMQTAPSDNKNLEFSAKDDLGWSHLMADSHLLDIHCLFSAFIFSTSFSGFVSVESGKRTAFAHQLKTEATQHAERVRGKKRLETP